MTESQKQARLATIAKTASSKPQGHMPTMAERAVQAKIDAKASNAKLAKRDFRSAITAGTGGATLGMSITFGADAQLSSIVKLPKQCRLLAQYLADIGGDNETATFAELNKHSEVQVGKLFWGKGTHEEYGQTVSKIASKYMPKLLGKDAWSKKIGKLEIIRVV